MKNKKKIIERLEEVRDFWRHLAHSNYVSKEDKIMYAKREEVTERIINDYRKCTSKKIDEFTAVITITTHYESSIDELELSYIKDKMLEALIKRKENTI